MFPARARARACTDTLTREPRVRGGLTLRLSLPPRCGGCCRNTRSQIVPMLIPSVFTWPFIGFRWERTCQSAVRVSVFKQAEAPGDLILIRPAIFSDFVTLLRHFLRSSSPLAAVIITVILFYDLPASAVERCRRLKEARESPRWTTLDLLHSAIPPSSTSLFFHSLFSFILLPCSDIEKDHVPLVGEKKNAHAEGFGGISGDYLRAATLLAVTLRGPRREAVPQGGRGSVPLSNQDAVGKRASYFTVFKLLLSCFFLQFGETLFTYLHNAL